MSLRVLCLGKTKESWLQEGLNTYLTRLPKEWKVCWQEQKDVSLKTAGSIEKVKMQEASLVLKALAADEFVIALDETGKEFTSVQFANFLLDLKANRDIIFVVGGVYGLDSSVRKRADLILSFSRFTFPHQLIRLLLCEQLYRAYTISSGKSYHY
ncbi:MAG TPA: 23S rRNA (pseudouridine(1915)-N(3))-methyltransferase RlmH [Candidatus Cloacimonadota bacterium]|nr:23S rRNA (pseudouridine(1915)-N(3))-methyltransferase RlmH [Candidatus Cloacimonadota bacterium]HOV16815.1 23S rRNA (pseudouridine(1915)-N(3))-methyltransferase RlmH [Candidatus Cloacimonadota bacterium]HQL14690.1 23S rRNA (pseudouridine(1915)-N(3))-methyltransferase RlmH [Candidatus Cloacimonadota bacterium]